MSTLDLSKYQAEAAKSNRAQCRETSCKQNIGLGCLRLGLQRSDSYAWYHAPCAFKTFDNRYLHNKPITKTSDIQDFEKLSEEHQELIHQLIAGTYVEPPSMSYNPRPKRGAAANANSEHAKSTADTTTPAITEPKKRKALDPDSTGTRSSDKRHKK